MRYFGVNGTRRSFKVTAIGQSLYDKVPILRPAIASTWGYYLRHIRYGEHTTEMAEAAGDREVWSQQQWNRWQRLELAKVLDHAARRVPYYREYWRKRRALGDDRSWMELENWPVLERHQLRTASSDLLAKDFDRNALHSERTSGTTGGPVTIWQSRKTLQQWYGLVEQRWRAWYGVSRHDRWALVGSQMVVPAGKTQPPFWVFNYGLNQLYMSTCHLSMDNAGHYLDAMRDYGVKYVMGHSSALYTIASAALRLGKQPPPLKLALSSSEPLPLKVKTTIAEGLRTPVYETYGMTEKAAAASECEFGRLHLWPDAGYYEVFSGDRPARPGEVGDLVATSLLNEAMPLIRYRVGDLIRIDPDPSTCPCGRAMPVTTGIHGRSSDVIVCKDGRLITPSSMEAIFDVDVAIEEGQIIQEDVATIRVKYVPAKGFRSHHPDILARGVRDRMGHVTVHMEAVDRIPREPNGKFRSVRTLLDPAIAHALRQGARG